MKDNTIKYSSKNHKHYPYLFFFLHVFFFSCSCFIYFLFACQCSLNASPLKNEAVAQGATLGCPALLVWCSPAGLCSQGSGTGPDAYTYLSKCSRNCQNFARSSAPVEQIGINESQGKQRFFFFFLFWGICGLTNKTQGSGTTWYICLGKSNKGTTRFLNCPGYSVHHEMDKLTKRVLWVHALWWIPCIWVYQHW